MKRIQLSQNKFALVDDHDFEFISQFNWHAINPTGEVFYAMRNIKPNDSFQYGGLMHRMILELKDTKIRVDHIDRNGLNNTRENLRIATPAQNARNSKMRDNNTTGYRGVYRSASGKRFVSQIMIEGKREFVGSFKTAKEASDAYEAYAIELFGEFYRKV